MARVVLLSGYSQMDTCPRNREQAILVEQTLLDMGHTVLHLNWFDEIQQAAALIDKTGRDGSVTGRDGVDGQRAEILLSAAAIVTFPDLKDSSGGDHISYLRAVLPVKPIIAVSRNAWMSTTETTESALMDKGATVFVVLNRDFNKNFQEALGQYVPEERAPDRKALPQKAVRPATILRKASPAVPGRALCVMQA
ncbi:MAG: hypothetical protein PHY92_07740 [Alphaproteobacteria bacterium]|nr:hypothetical protein [Alphaproteobacteria bacterium]